MNDIHGVCVCVCRNSNMYGYTFLRVIAHTAAHIWRYLRAHVYTCKWKLNFKSGVFLDHSTPHLLMQGHSIELSTPHKASLGESHPQLHKQWTYRYTALPVQLPWVQRIQTVLTLAASVFMSSALRKTSVQSPILEATHIISNTKYHLLLERVSLSCLSWP